MPGRKKNKLRKKRQELQKGKRMEGKKTTEMTASGERGKQKEKNNCREGNKREGRKWKKGEIETKSGEREREGEVEVVICCFSGCRPTRGRRGNG